MLAPFAVTRTRALTAGTPGAFTECRSNSNSDLLPGPFANVDLLAG